MDLIWHLSVNGIVTMKWNEASAQCFRFEIEKGWTNNHSCIQSLPSRYFNGEDLYRYQDSIQMEQGKERDDPWGALLICQPMHLLLAIHNIYGLFLKESPAISKINLKCIMKGMAMTPNRLDWRISECIFKSVIIVS